MEQLLGVYPKEEVLSFFYRLTEHILKLKRIDLSLNPNKSLTRIEQQQFNEAVSRLLKNEPIQYIIGETEFYGLPFTVNTTTLIPRPETEELVDWIIRDHKSSSELTILDIGTGSGCIAILLAKHLLNAKVYAIDISKGALKIAQENAIRNNVTVNFVENNILNETTWNLNFEHIKFDIIVSNPPYIQHLEKNKMQANVLDFEPHLALFVEDSNPLQFYKKIAQFAKEKLKTNGQLYFEINEYLGPKTTHLLKNKGFKTIELRKDIFEKDRMIKASF